MAVLRVGRAEARGPAARRLVGRGRWGRGGDGRDRERQCERSEAPAKHGHLPSSSSHRVEASAGGTSGVLQYPTAARPHERWREVTENRLCGELWASLRLTAASACREDSRDDALADVL